MSDFDIGGFSKEKFYMLQAKAHNQQSVDEQKKVDQKEKEKQQKLLEENQSQTTGIQWAPKPAQNTQAGASIVIGANQVKSATDKKSSQPEILLPDEGDIATLSTSVLSSGIAAAERAKKKQVSDPLTGFRAKTASKFTRIFQDAYAGSFSHNRLLGKMSELKAGVAMKMMSLFGVPAAEIDSIRGEVRRQLIDQNHTNMKQVVYDKTLLEIIS